MKTYRKTVLVSIDKTGPFDVAKLKAAIASSNPIGALNCTVVAKFDEAVQTGFLITGDAVAADPNDFASEDAIAALDSRLQRDLGSIGRVTDDDPSGEFYEASNATTFDYVLNHSGLPLAYGEAIKKVFAKPGVGKLDPVEFAAAIMWAAKNEPSLVSNPATIDQAKILLAYRGRSI